ncbi:MAG: STAS domain-containing protein [Gammaproteobacteria bacterium]|nr:STAS domain-containing protein [Gammaproteobacteria bacterium]
MQKKTTILQLRNYLVATVQTTLVDQDFITLRDRLVSQVGNSRCTGVVLDVSELDVLDSFCVRTLSDMARMIRLRGADMLIVGIQPGVAFSMAQLGLDLDGVPTALDLDEGLAYLDSKSRRSSGRIPAWH